MENQQFKQTIQERFIGRSEALEAVKTLRLDPSGEKKTGVYYVGPGGSGKTWILRKIQYDMGETLGVRIPAIIDFYDTQNNHLHGLQDSIKQRFNDPEAFRKFDADRKRMRDEQQRGEKANDSVVGYLDRLAYKEFIRACNAAAQKQKVLLLFDTFERAQNRYAGSWLLKTFLNEVRGVMVVIAGRPAPRPAAMPAGLTTHHLTGLTLPELTEYIHRQIPFATQEMVQTIWEHTNGVPLLVQLVLDLPVPLRDHFVDDLKQLPAGRLIQDIPDLQRTLVRQFATPMNNRNRVIMAMAYLWRRFDLPMLKYIVDHGTWFKPDDYQAILNQLSQSVYIKEYPEQQTHLLHDEIQRMVAHFLLTEVADPDRDMRDPLYDIVVDRYYNEIIRTADKDMLAQLYTEQLGYILDRDSHKGLKQYENLLAKPELRHDHDAEELMWGEIRDNLPDYGPDEGYRICLERGRRLQGYLLWERAEEHYQEMLERYTQNNQRFQTAQSLGYMIYRQGRLDEARQQFEASRRWMHDPVDDSEVAQLENNLGQVEQSTGLWDEALNHYDISFDAAQRAEKNQRMIDAYINRGYLYSLKGYFKDAMHQCDSAIDLLEDEQDDFFRKHRSVYAYRNKGMVYRHNEEFQKAVDQYQLGLEIAWQTENEAAFCDVSQQLGICLHLFGRSLRRQNNLPPDQMMKSIDYQIQSANHLQVAIDIARKSNSRNAIGDGLNRLAKLYREVHHLTKSLVDTAYPPYVESKLDTLIRNLESFDMTFDEEYMDRLTVKEPFDRLSWLGKCERLFEVSALIAIEIKDYYRALDSLTETARTLMWLGKLAEAETVIGWFSEIREQDVQVKVLKAITELSTAHLEFVRRQYPQALERFTQAFSELANTTGYAAYLLGDRLRDLEWRLRDLLEADPQLAKDWCDHLLRGWDASGALRNRPDMRFMLERIRREVIKKIKQA